MPGLLEKPVTDAERRDNDRHRPLVVAAAVFVLTVYLYLFTQIATPLGLPLPEDLVQQFGLSVPHVFDDDGNVDSNLYIAYTQRLERNDDERLFYFTLLIAAFLSVYFLRLELKRPAMVAWTLLALLILYGPKPTCALLFCHLVVYLVLHADVSNRRSICVFSGLLAWSAFVLGSDLDPWLQAASAVALPFGAVALHHVLRAVLARPRAAAVIRPLVVHSAIVFMCVAVAVESSGGPEWKLALGVFMFYWQWPRVAMYYIDLQDGQVPEDLPIVDFLSVFISPGVVPNWSWGVAIPQGYAYLNSNFLSRDKNAIIVGGIRILCIALLYLVTWNWVRYAVADFFSDLGVPVYRASTRSLVVAFMRGQDVSTASVLLTTFLDLFRFMMFLGGVLHFKVGVWRLMGYDVAPYYNRFWTSTNLVAIWGRFAFHYREFMVRAFYYPVFFRFFRKHRDLRIFTATMAAAMVGNFLWHISERTGFRGFEWEEVVFRLGTWPYFLLLGLGISTTQIYLMKRRRRRRSWTLDRWLAADVVAAYLTIQYFGLLHIFARPAAGADTWDLFRLFMIGLGIHI